ncbi:MAG: glycosyl hydrolase 53 family protein [Lachnospiraceae bacterium]|nr:glycosyl hydrolase 53 family protein [Lachnospiraceae bacterium]MDE7274433.1 glycosyl hydrolase 53 family protein [Lachnospiraceae bacterium]
MLDYIKGMDISSLDEIEKLGAKFYDNGKEGDLIQILKSYDTNYIRLRLWNDPKSPEGKPYGAGNTDYETTLRMAKRVKAAGLGFLLDFHYSDFWADPGKQRKPKAWADYNVDQLERAVYDFTKEMMTGFVKEGVAPDMVQVGNELSKGFLWPEGQIPNYANITRFISAGIRAVREVCPTAKVMLHLDNGGNNALYREWFDQYIHVNKGEDFDIIGLSYYPFWHGTLEDLSNNMQDIAVRFGKELVVAEVSMGHTTQDYAAYEKLAPEDRKGMATKLELCEKVPFAMTKEGQCDFMRAFFAVLEKVPEKKGRGFFYWEAGWLPVPGSGWATEAALAYIKESGPGGNEWANQALFDYDGNALPALEVIRDYRPK